MADEPSYNDLEIYLFKPDRDRYMANLRFTNPDDPAAQPPTQRWTALAAEGGQSTSGTPSAGGSSTKIVTLDDLAAEVDSLKYGQILTDALLNDPETRAFLETVRAVTETANKCLRLRLFIDPSAQELHDLRWETLRDPRDGTWLAANPELPFSRFLTNPSWKSVRLRKQSELRALVVVANPKELETGQWEIPEGHVLAKVKVADELTRARDGLGDKIHTDDLASDHNAPLRVTLEAIKDKLDQGDGYDVLFLVCHGAYITRQDPPGPFILLEDVDGAAIMEPGAALANLLSGLEDRKCPRLVVLASCQSSGAASDVKGSLARLGPLLAQAGVPAVLAMQGDVTQESVALFMPEFFKTLRETGLVDLAAARGRAKLESNNRDDRWMPVIFHRLRDSRLWYTPQVSEKSAKNLWDRLFNGLKDQGRFVPIVGPALSEYLCGPLNLAARELAAQQNYPLRENSREEMQYIAQYLEKRDGPGSPRLAWLEFYRNKAQADYSAHLASAQAGSTDQETLANQLAIVCHQHILKDPLDAYNVLAHLPFRIYLTATPDNLLEQALIEAGRTPVVDFARWNPELMSAPSEIAQASSATKNYEPDKNRPLLYHMFGTFRLPESLVLSEEDYLNYLMWISNADLNSLRVGSYITQPGLLLLGFGPLDWNFRVLYRSLQYISKGKRSYNSIAVQVTPGEEIVHPAMAREYFKQYLGQLGQTDVGIYWGNVGDFIEELYKEAVDRNVYIP